MSNLSFVLDVDGRITCVFGYAVNNTPEELEEMFEISALELVDFLPHKYDDEPKNAEELQRLMIECFVDYAQIDILDHNRRSSDVYSLGQVQRKMIVNKGFYDYLMSDKCLDLVRGIYFNSEKEVTK